MGRKVYDIDSLYRVVPELRCPLCKRLIPSNPSNHHLVPRSQGGGKGETVDLHKICHDKVHSVFTEKELSRYYNTIEKLLEHEEIKRFVEWVSTKPDDYYDSSKITMVKKWK